MRSLDNVPIPEVKEFMKTILFHELEAALKGFGPIGGLEDFVRLTISKSYEKGWHDALSLKHWKE